MWGLHETAETPRKALCLATGKERGSSPLGKANDGAFWVPQLA